MEHDALDGNAVRRLVEAAARELDGEWLLVGGGAAALWFAHGRVTEDIDLIGLLGTQAERLALMELAAAQGLPVEVVNSPADFFVRRIADWRDQLRVLVSGRAIIHGPNPTLFLLLKLGRLSAVDLGDCLGLLAHIGQTDEAVDAGRVRAAIVSLPATTDAYLGARRAALHAALASFVAP